jgi:hypothetical protein
MQKNLILMWEDFMKHMKLMLSGLLNAGALITPICAIARDVDCSKFDHARAYWADEDGTPHWRLYSFSSDCSEVKIQKWRGHEIVGQPQIDKIDGVFQCIKASGDFCSYGFGWKFDGNKITSTVEKIHIVPNGERQFKETILRDISIRQDGVSQELLTSESYIKEPSEPEWFNTKTERSRCILTSLPDCQWSSLVQR